LVGRCYEVDDIGAITLDLVCTVYRILVHPPRAGVNGMT
jgi:hypothetical protein